MPEFVWVPIVGPWEYLVDRQGRLFGEQSGREYMLTMPWNPKQPGKWYVRTVETPSVTALLHKRETK